MVSGIARRALSVIHEAAQATGSTESHGGSGARVGSSRQGAEASGGPRPFVYLSGASQGVLRQDVKVQARTERFLHTCGG